MSVDAAPSDLTKVDSAISGLSSSPPDDKAAVKGHRRASSSAAGVYNIADLGKSNQEDYSSSGTKEHTIDETHRKGRQGIADSKGDAKTELVGYAIP